MKFNDCFFSASPHRMTGVGHMTRKVLRECLMSREETHTNTHTQTGIVSVLIVCINYCTQTWLMAELEPQ